MTLPRPRRTGPERPAAANDLRPMSPDATPSSLTPSPVGVPGVPGPGDAPAGPAPSRVRYATPETPDGVIRDVRHGSDEGTPSVEVDIEFRVSKDFKSRCQGAGQSVAFAARSRIARLGIDVEPTGNIVFDNGVAHLTARLSANVREYGLDRFLGALIVPGLKLGRLVLCPEENQLSSDEIYSSLERNEFQLPSGFSIGADGSFTIQTHKLRYALSKKLSPEDALAILTQEGGKSILNRIQIPRPVEYLLIPPGHGIITSCSMFLHKHYVVINPDAGAHGRHLHATVLDPVATRGTRVFLEILNSSDRQIVNPFVTAKIYTAEERIGGTRFYPVAKVEQARAEQQRSRALPTYEALAAYYDAHVPGWAERSYRNRPLVVVDDLHGISEGRAPLIVSKRPEAARKAPASLRSTVDYTQAGASADSFATRALGEVPADKRATLLLSYFPNLLEHMAICNAVLEKRVGTIVFRRASFEHGQFFSANDHTRMADYEALGARLLWCNDDRRHVALHAFRGLRGYFVEPAELDRFKNTLVLAVYGSADKLSEADVGGLRELLRQIQELFGGHIAILTGGGPGAMQQATDIALDFGLLAGANYIETIDQGTNKAAHFYQCFQDRNRHNRQRWFDIASFVMFCVGGLGTLEEVGLTLTDMKLGMVERGPVVFFGKYKDDAYWTPIQQQFRRMAEAGRAPAWVLDNILFTGDAGRITAFYKKVLGLG
jgi:predicted Rossmann-fold nucleotide-binding protein